MITFIKNEIRHWVSDFWKYMDTTIPRGVNGEMFIDLKYTNRENINSYLESHKDAQIRLLEQVAIRDFMNQDTKTIEEKMRRYNE